MEKAEHRQPSGQPLKIIDLFAGIGGFSLAAHWRGWETAAFVEKEPYCQKVLEKNFPSVPIINDIRNYKPKKHAAKIICGGFPCQPFSTAGNRKGTSDDRYLWPEMLRVIREVQPDWVIGENVAGLISMDGGAVLEEICTDLESKGYTVQAFVIPAISQGAPHRRDRVWIVAYAEKAKRKQSGNTWARGARLTNFNKSSTDTNHLLHARGLDKRGDRKKAGGSKKSNECEVEVWPKDWQRVWAEFSASYQDTTHTSGAGLQGSEQSGIFKKGQPKQKSFRPATKCNKTTWGIHWHEVATRLCRVDDGLPSWVDGHRAARLKALGNAIVPQVADALFSAIEQHYIQTKGCACT